MVLSACKKEATTDVGSQPVIISYLVMGHPIRVNLYQQKGFSDTVTFGARITGMAVQVSDGSQTIKLAERTAGVYTYTDSTFLQTGKTYTLQFTYNGANVTASTLMPVAATGYAASKNKFAIKVGVTAAEFDSTAVRFTWNNPDSLYNMLVFRSDVSQTYTSATGNIPTNFSIDTKQAKFYDVTYRRFRYAGPYSAILYTVNKEYIDILTTNTNTSSQQLNNPPGNITNGYGIFTAMQADTIRLNVTN
ncbi:hypothetical protein A0256_22910 [Mucilaginibacter sp. PAMC 26640]|nr:hypothetical protein A0256_22910 [Mucilaginibacter sp. PAMC 26640]